MGKIESSISVIVSLHGGELPQEEIGNAAKSNFGNNPI